MTGSAGGAGFGRRAADGGDAGFGRRAADGGGAGGEVGRGADFLQLTAAAAPVRGLTGWLAGAIRAAIMDGRLAAGTVLPASRVLAGDLGISRGVVVQAYQRLADE